MYMWSVASVLTRKWKAPLSSTKKVEQYVSDLYLTANWPATLFFFSTLFTTPTNDPVDNAGTEWACWRWCSERWDSEVVKIRLDLSESLDHLWISSLIRLWQERKKKNHAHSIAGNVALLISQNCIFFHFDGRDSSEWKKCNSEMKKMQMLIGYNLYMRWRC